MSVRIETLGGLRIYRNGEELTSLLGKPVQCALLVYLAIERNATKDELQALLWPEKHPAKARGSLNNTMYELRSELGQWADLHGDEFRAADWVSTDIDDLLAAVDSGSIPERATSLLDPYLDATYLASAPEFERWVGSRRASIRRRQQGLEKRLVITRYESGTLNDALRCARAWANRYPLDDDAQYWAIRCEAESGHRGDALGRFEGFAAALRERHGVEPSEAVRRLVEAVQAGQLSGGQAGFEEIQPPVRRVDVERATPGSAWRPEGGVSRRLVKLLGGYVAASWVTLQVISLLLDRYSTLPDTFFDAALVLLLCGIPVVVATVFFQSRPVVGETLTGLRFLLARWFSWRNTALGGTAAVAAWFTAAIGWIIVGAPGTSDLDSNRVVVFPMVTTGLISNPTAGLDVALAIGAALEHTEPLRFVDGWRLLDPALRQDASSVTPDVANLLSATNDAAFFIEGAIWIAGDSLSLTLRLIDVERDSVVTQETARGQGSESSFPGLAMAAMVPLLPHITGEGQTIDLSPIADRTVASTALWLQGERAYRSARFSEAGQFFERAVLDDSLHVFAALRGAQAASYSVDAAASDDLMDLVLSQSDRLPLRYQALAAGLKAHSMGDADEALRQFHAALEVAPGWAEAAMAVGEVYYHLLPDGATHPDSLARSWLAEAYAADSTFVPPLFHLSQLALRGEQPDEAARLVRAWSRSNPEPVLLRQVELASQCVAGRMSASWGELLPEESRAVLQAGEALTSARGGSSCAVDAYLAVFESDTDLAVRWTALKALVALEASMGRTDRVRGALEAGLAEGIRPTWTLYTYATLAGLPMSGEATRGVELLTEVFGLTMEGAPPRWRWVVGAQLAHAGDVTRLTALADDFLQDASASGDRKGVMLANDLAARARLASGDTATAIDILRNLRPTADAASIRYDESEGLAAPRILLAELLLATGDAEGAFHTASLIDHGAPIMYPMFRPRSLEIRRSAAVAMGDTEGARSITERMNQLTSHQ